MGPRSDIFLKTDENINLAIPIIFLLLLILGFPIGGFFQSTFGDSSRLAQRLMADIIFLNITHNAFTVMMIASFPELRPWMKAEGGGNERRFIGKVIMIFVVLFVLFLSALLLENKWLFILFSLASAFFPIQHALAQSLGLSLVYNSKTQDEPERKRRYEWLERRLVMAFMLLIVGSVVALRSNVIPAEVLKSEYGLSYQSVLFRIALGLAIAIAGMMVLYPKKIRGKKTLFALRYPVWAYSLVSPLGLIATQIVHGLEYFFVFRKMSTTSKFEKWKSASLLLLFLVIVFGIFRVIYENGYAGIPMKGPLWLTIIAALSTAFSFLHYYLDRKMFLMRKPANQQTVGRLLR